MMEELEGVLETLRKLLIAWKLHVQVFLSCFPSHFTDSNIISEGVPDWQQWGPWSQCSASCGLGSTLRARSCCDSNLRGNTTCVGNSTEAKDCTSAACQGNPMLYEETKFQRQYNCRQPIAVSDISVYICLIDIIQNKSKEQLNERRAGLSI